MIQINLEHDTIAVLHCQFFEIIIYVILQLKNQKPKIYFMMGIQKKLFVAINSCDLSELSKAKTENLWASQSIFEIKKEGSKVASFSRKIPLSIALEK